MLPPMVAGSLSTSIKKESVSPISLTPQLGSGRALTRIRGYAHTLLSFGPRPNRIASVGARTYSFVKRIVQIQLKGIAKRFL